MAADDVIGDYPGQEPERITVVRWKCPHCSRSRSSRAATADHIGRCWHNPANRACRTCKFFYGGDNGCGDPGCGPSCASEAFCHVGVDLGEHDVVVHCESWKPADWVPNLVARLERAG